MVSDNDSSSTAPEEPILVRDWPIECIVLDRQEHFDAVRALDRILWPEGGGGGNRIWIIDHVGLYAIDGAIVTHTIEWLHRSK